MNISTINLEQAFTIQYGIVSQEFKPLHVNLDEGQSAQSITSQFINDYLMEVPDHCGWDAPMRISDEDYFGMLEGIQDHLNNREEHKYMSVYLTGLQRKL